MREIVKGFIAGLIIYIGFIFVTFAVITNIHDAVHGTNYAYWFVELREFMQSTNPNATYIGVKGCD